MALKMMNRFQKKSSTPFRQ